MCKHLDVSGIEPLIEETLALIAAERLEDAETLAAEISMAAPEAATPVWVLGACRLRRGNAVGAIDAFDVALSRAQAAMDDEVKQLAHLGRAEARMKLGHRFLAGIDLELAASGIDPAVSRHARASAATMRIAV